MTVTDSATPAGTASASLTIDVAQLAVTAISLPEGAVGTPYPATQLTASGGTGALTWTSSGALPAGLSLSATGVLTGTPTAAGQATFTVTVTDSATPAKTDSLELSVSILGISTTTLPEGSVGAAYSQALVSTGGTGTLTWTSSGALPAGLSLSASGTISGAPTAAGAASFTVTVTDSATPPQQAAGQFTLSVLGITTTTLPEGAVGTAYPASQLIASGGTGTLTWTSSGALPAGLSLSASGLITGNPTAAGPATFTVTVTDGATPPQQASTPLTISVAAEPVEVPQVHGRPGSARDKLLSLGLIVADQVLEAISDKPSGTVVGSYPPAGSLVPPGTSIQLAVSNAVEVPSVIGFSLEQAEEVLSEAGFGVSTSTEGDGGEYPVVRHQSPEGGFWVPRRSTVSLVLGAPDYAESGRASETARSTTRDSESGGRGDGGGPAPQQPCDRAVRRLKTPAP